MNQDSPAPASSAPPVTWTSLIRPHRVVLVLVAGALIYAAVTGMRWDWLPHYQGMLLAGIGRTIALLFSSAIIGMVLAVGLGIAQVAGPWWVRWLSNGFCSVIRGTPLLLQLWLLYYGLGSVVAQFPEFRREFPELAFLFRQSWLYGFVALTLSFAGYEGEVMRGAFAGVPRGELEAARAFGMGRFTLFRRIWLPRAIHRALPTLNGETVLQLKATPLVATITVMDVFGVVNKVKSATLLTYEPLLLLALVYLILTGLLVAGFRYFESRIPVKM